MALEGKLGLAVSEAPDAGGCPFPVELSAVMPHQAMLAPLPYLLGLAKEASAQGCRIFEGTPVLDMHGRRLKPPAARSWRTGFCYAQACRWTASACRY